MEVVSKCRFEEMLTPKMIHLLKIYRIWLFNHPPHNTWGQNRLAFSSREVARSGYFKNFHYCPQDMGIFMCTFFFIIAIVCFMKVNTLLFIFVLSNLSHVNEWNLVCITSYLNASDTISYLWLFEEFLNPLAYKWEPCFRYILFRQISGDANNNF